MITDVSEQTTDDVWVLCDAVSVMTVCFAWLETRSDSGDPRCGAAIATAVTLKEAREVRTTVISKTGGCHIVTLSGQPMSLHRRQKVPVDMESRQMWRDESGDRRSRESESRGAGAADGGTWPWR